MVRAVFAHALSTRGLLLSPHSLSARVRTASPPGRGSSRSFHPRRRTAEYPDGLPDGAIDPKHVNELKWSNRLLERTVNLAIAARRSPSRATIMFENPADRSVRSCPSYSEELKNHGSISRRREAELWGQ